MERQTAKTFRDLIVWQKAHQLTLAVYRLTDAFPKHELFGLTSQLRRAAVSVPANLAEGFRKQSPKDKVRIFNIAEGLLEEVHYYFILAHDLQYADTRQLSEQANEVGRLLEGYCKTVRASITASS